MWLLAQVANQLRSAEVTRRRRLPRGGVVEALEEMTGTKVTDKRIMMWASLGPCLPMGRDRRAVGGYRVGVVADLAVASSSHLGKGRCSTVDGTGIFHP